MALALKLNPELLNHCENDSQRQAVEAVIKCGSVKAASMALEVSERWLFVLLSRVRCKAEKAGVLSSDIVTRPMATKQLRVKKKARYVITCAQNATPVFPEGLATLRTYCKHNKAELVVIPIRYHNPTSAWTKTDESSDWWAKEIEADIVDTRTELNANLVLLADIRIQPTAVRPTSGLGTSSAC